MLLQHLYNTLRLRQNGRLLADDILEPIFLNENTWIFINISLNVALKGQINNIPALVQIMAWRRTGDKPLSEPMLIMLLTHICVTRPQWVNLFLRLLCLETDIWHLIWYFYSYCIKWQHMHWCSYWIITHIYPFVLSCIIHILHLLFTRWFSLNYYP